MRHRIAILVLFALSYAALAAADHLKVLEDRYDVAHRFTLSWDDRTETFTGQANGAVWKLTEVDTVQHSLEGTLGSEDDPRWAVASSAGVKQPFGAPVGWEASLSSTPRGPVPRDPSPTADFRSRWDSTFRFMVVGDNTEVFLEWRACGLLVGGWALRDLTSDSVVREVSWSSSADPGNEFPCSTLDPGRVSGLVRLRLEDAHEYALAMTMAHNGSDVNAGSQFRFTTNADIVTAGTPPPSYSLKDFNRDGHDDVLLQSESNNSGIAGWFLSGPGGNETLGTDWLDEFVGRPWKLVATGDFNTDGYPDLVVQHSPTYYVAIIYVGGPHGYNPFGTRQPGDSNPRLVSEAAPTGWSVAGSADLNRDGHPDLILRNDTTRQIGAWYLGGPLGIETLATAWITEAGLGTRDIVATGDLNHDGHDDLVLQDQNTRYVSVWYLGGPTGTDSLTTDWVDQTGLDGWQPVGTSDLNQDGQLDLVWQHDQTRQVFVSYLGGEAGNRITGGAWLAEGGVPDARVSAR